MRVYTRAGDKGKTKLFGGEVTDKDDIRLEACGTVDELNTFLGMASLHCSSREVRNLIVYLQNDLFTLQSEIAAQSPQAKKLHSINEEHLIEMEHHIDRIERQLPQQEKFILPGGNLGSSFLQVARAITRRTERRIVSLNKLYALSPYLCQYINRLSDFLHVLSRAENKAQNEKNPTYNIVREKEKQQEL